MKQLFVLITTLLANIAFAADWTYDSATATVSDGVWTFGATVNGTEITFGRIKTDALPAETSALDLSKSVSDGSVSYTIVSLDGLFGSLTWNDQNVWDSGATARGKLGELTLPGEGLRIIAGRSFYATGNATGTVVIPSTVTEVGPQAFYSDSKLTIHAANPCTAMTRIGRQAFDSVKMTGEFTFPAVQTVGWNAFRGSTIGSVTFGPALTKLIGKFAAKAGPFAGCTSLSNVVFDADSSVEITDGGAFADCTKLKKLDLSCVTKITCSEQRVAFSHFVGSGVESITFSRKLTSLAQATFIDATKISEVHFAGPPPTTLGTPVYDGASSGKILTTYVHISEADPDYAAAKEAWDALTAGEEILESGSTWSSAMVGSSYATRPLVIYVPDDPGERGHWIYDARGGTPVVSNGLWTFAATISGKQVAVGQCTAWPSEITELDFSKSVTDPEGRVRSFDRISPAFSSGASSAGAGAASVGKLTFPESGLLQIGAWAFANCVNCTEISNAIPDSVSSLGEGAFYNVPLSEGKGNIRLMGLTSVPANAFAKCANLERVWFGPSLVRIAGGMSNAAFLNCTHLTNIVFDTSMSGGNVDSQDAPFYGCSKLSGDYELYGFVNLNGPFFNGTAVGSVTLPASCGTIARHCFRGMSQLTNVVFKGIAPLFWSDTYKYMQDVDANRKVPTFVYKANLTVSNSANKCWLDYADNGTIARKHTTWSATYLYDGVPTANRELRMLDGMPGFVLIVR